LSQLSKHLRANEKVLWSGKPVMMPFILTGGVLVGFMFGIFFMVLSASAFSYTFTFPRVPLPIVALFLFFFLIVFFVAFGPIIYNLLRYSNTEYMITNQRMVTQTGAIGLDTRFVDLEKIQEVYVRIDIIDKIFGTGSLHASTAAGWVGYGTRYSFRPTLDSLKDPYNVQRILQEAIEKARTSAKLS